MRSAARAAAHHHVCSQSSTLGLGSSFLARLARDPQVLAIVDGDVRLTYAEWYRRISAPAARARVDAEAWSVMLYTSGITARPKGVPPRHRVERAAAVAHVAQNLYARAERTLGVMPLYHTMGVRSPIAMSLLSGAFVCLRRFDVEQALSLITAERVTNLYLVPTLSHDLVHHPLFAVCDVSSVRKLGFAGAPMTGGLLKELQAAFKLDLFVNHYGSSEVNTFTVEQDAPPKPGSAGRTGINQMVRVVKLGAKSVDDFAAIDEKDEIIALLSGDESSEGYWRRPGADAEALRHDWYFTGDTGFLDANGDIFVTGRPEQLTARTPLNATEDTNLQTAIELEGHCYGQLRQPRDFREGVEAFRAKRKPLFRGT